MDTFLAALAVFSAQLVVIISAAALAELLGGVTDPRLRFPFWRGVAIVCLALPLSALVVPATADPGVTFLGTALDAAAPPGVAAVLPAAERGAWWLLCAGVLARLGWLCAGAARLRQLRRLSTAAVLTPDLEALRAAVAPCAEIRVCPGLAQPAGFGLRRPLVLLPPAFFAMEGAAQRTVACHELLHVARRDWLWIVVEEAVGALFWFHPAVWWLVERIQESREQLVDRGVIARLPSKQAYMRALLAFADGDRLPAPATAFVRKRQLRSRLRMLAKESLMSRKRFVWTAVVLACVMGAAIGGTVVALPLGPALGDLAAPAQEVVDGKAEGVTMPKVVSEVKPQYTPEAMKARIEGIVIMRAVVGTDGTAGDIEIVKSLDAEYGLDKAAVDALAGWRFEPGVKDGKRVAVRVTVEMRFTLKS